MGSTRASTARNQLHRQRLALCMSLAAAAAAAAGTTTTTAFTAPHATTRTTSSFSYQQRRRWKISNSYSKMPGSVPYLSREKKRQTELFVGSKWQLPFLGTMDEDGTNSKDDEKSVNTSNNGRGVAIKTTSPPLLSSFFQQDTVEETEEKMGNLMDFMSFTMDNKNEEEDSASSNMASSLLAATTNEPDEASTETTDSTMLPLFGALAVALAVAGASATGMVYVNTFFVC